MENEYVTKSRIKGMFLMTEGFTLKRVDKDERGFLYCFDKTDERIFNAIKLYKNIVEADEAEPYMIDFNKIISSNRMINEKVIEFKNNKENRLIDE